MDKTNDIKKNKINRWTVFVNAKIMEISEYQHIYKNEGTHFYYLATHKLVLTLIQNNLNNIDKKLNILDAGCGAGLLAKHLERFGDVVGVDVNPQAIYFSSKRKIKVVKASINKLPFKKNEFDIITSVDVIYHDQVNDKEALKELYRVLKPGGLLIIRVPAYKWLIRSSDKQVHTRERYNHKMFNDRLIRARFKVAKISYVQTLLLLFAVIQKTLEIIFRVKEPSSSIKKINPFFNNLILLLLLAEVKLVQFINFPFGLGLVAVARK